MTVSYEDSTKTLTVTYSGNDSLSTITEKTDKEINNLNVVGAFKRIEANAFQNCGPVYNLNLSDSVESVGNNVIQNLNILTFHIPKSFQYYDQYQPFDYCYTLKEFTIDKENAYFSVKDGVLFDKEMIILYMYPNGKEDISYTIPYGVRTIFNAAFAQTVFLKHLFIPSTVNSSRNIMFKTQSNPTITVIRCPCTNVEESIGYTSNADLVYNISQMEFTSEYNETMSSDGKILIISPLINCAAQYANIDYKSTNFADDKNIKTIVFEKGITKISKESFVGCTSVNHIVFLDALESINNKAFSGIKFKYNSIVYPQVALSMLRKHFSSLALGLVSPTISCNHYRSNFVYYIMVILVS